MAAKLRTDTLEAPQLLPETPGSDFRVQTSENKTESRVWSRTPGGVYWTPRLLYEWQTNKITMEWSRAGGVEWRAKGRGTGSEVRDGVLGQCKYCTERGWRGGQGWAWQGWGRGDLPLLLSLPRDQSEGLICFFFGPQRPIINCALISSSSFFMKSKKHLMANYTYITKKCSV